MNEPVPPWLLYQLVVSRTILTGDPNGNPFPPTSTTVPFHRPAFRPRSRRATSVPPEQAGPLPTLASRRRAVRPRLRAARPSLIPVAPDVPRRTQRAPTRVIVRPRRPSRLVPDLLAVPAQQPLPRPPWRRLRARRPAAGWVVAVQADTAVGRDGARISQTALAVAASNARLDQSSTSEPTYISQTGAATRTDGD